MNKILGVVVIIVLMSAGALVDILVRVISPKTLLLDTRVECVVYTVSLVGSLMIFATILKKNNPT